MNDKFLNLQLFADDENETPVVVDNRTKTGDLAPAISLDMNTRFVQTIAGLQEVLGVTSMLPMNEGDTVKTYKTVKDVKTGVVGEGDEIPLSKYSRAVDQTITLAIHKHRIEVTAEAIQKYGEAIAINLRDEEALLDAQYEILTDFYSMLTTSATSSSTITKTSFQAALAGAWAKLRTILKRKNVTPIYFVSTEDVAEYLGAANITVQTAYGLSYVENFLGLGTVIVTPELTKGTIYATAKENINGVYIPVASSAVGRTFGMTPDATGMVGMKHFTNDVTLCLNTLLVDGVKFYPELKDAVVKATISANAS